MNFLSRSNRATSEHRDQVIIWTEEFYGRQKKRRGLSMAFNIGQMIVMDHVHQKAGLVS